MKFNYCLSMLIFFPLHGMIQDNITTTSATPAFLEKHKIGELKISDQATLVQANVLDQFSIPGNTTASCGYHALRNGILLAKCFHSTQQRDQLLQQLYSVEHANALFGKNGGTWRSKIAERRENTDWLDRDELNKLIDLEKSCRALNIKRTPIAFYGDETEVQPEDNLSLEEAWSLKESFDLVQPNRELMEIKRRILNGENFAAAILLNVAISPDPFFLDQINDGLKESVSSLFPKKKNKTLAEVSQEAREKRRHWITVVVDSLNGKRQYIVTDSDKNSPRLYDNKVIELIGILEDGITENKDVIPSQLAEATQINEITINALPQAFPPIAPINISSLRDGAHVSSLKARFVKPPSTTVSTMTRYLVYSALVGTISYTAYRLYKKYFTQRDTAKNTVLNSSSNASIMM